ncbi:MAG: TMEM175 family protein [Rubrobacteraceae bacterium]
MAGSRENTENGRELDRIVFFSDAVFAIAITLLVLDIHVPEIPERLVDEQLPGRLLALWPKYLSYVLSFVVILMYWMAHHITFRAIKRYDRTLIWLNSLFLMCIAFLPFPTSLLGEYGDNQLAVAIYAASVAVARLLLTAVWWYASSGHRLIDESFPESTIRIYLVRGLAVALAFVISIGISFFSVSAATYFWILLVVADNVLIRVLSKDG